MKPYKSLFSESTLDVQKKDTNEIVDISNLQWKHFGQMNWTKAMNSAPAGYRLPTVQELYTAYVQEVVGFDNQGYWSSSTHAGERNAAWVVNFHQDGRIGFDGKWENHFVCYVTEI